LAEYLDIAPSHAAVPAGTQRFHSSFFCGKPRGVALDPISFRVAVPDLLFGKHTTKKPLTKTLDGFSNARDFGYVDPRAYDHADTLARTVWVGHFCPTRAIPGN
jgi:hypothetical protein